MKRAIFLTCLSAAAAMTVAGCGRTLVRETVVERPVPQTVVQAPAACNVAGTNFSSGSLSCQGGYEYRCTNGMWEQTGRGC